MFIQTESTPNPNSLKFMVQGKCSDGETMQYDSPAGAPAFVQNIFKLDGIENVYITSAFITVAKKEDEEWDYLKVQILEILFEDSLNESPPATTSASKVYQQNIIPEELDEISRQIISLLEERVAPAVARDGGEIKFIKFEKDTGVVRLQLKGSCSGCPSSAVTLQSGIKNMLMHYIPEVTEVKEAEEA